MEEYLEQLLSQIRCKKARPFVEEELRSHMEDQISDYMAAAILGLCFTAGMYGIQIGGVTYYMRSIRFSIFALMMFYVPVYGAVLYQYHNTGYRGFAKAVLWMVLPVFGAFRLPSLMLSAVLLVSMMVQMTIAVAKGWFLVPKKKVLAGLWITGAGLPVFSLVFSYASRLLAEYQRERIRAFLTNSGDANYITGVFRSLAESNKLVGSGGKEVIGVIPNFNSDYIFTYLTASYGILAGAAVLCILAAVIFMVFGVSIRQKNQLGMVMGCGCGMVFLLNTVINVMENMGWLPLSQTFLPFLSAGGSCLVMSYGLIGIILSIYRYKNVYPSHVKTAFSKGKLPIEL